MVQFLSIIFFLGFLQFLLGFSKVPVFLCHPVHTFQFITYKPLYSIPILKFPFPLNVAGGLFNSVLTTAIVYICHLSCGLSILYTINFPILITGGFYVFATVHCNIIIQYKPKKCIFSKLIL